MAEVVPSQKVRLGDAIAIAGDYQHRARTQGFVVQRYWHYEKERVVRKFCPPLSGEAVLDVGCGSGVIVQLLASLGARATGIDGNADAIEYAKATFGGDGAEFRCCRVEDLEFPEASFDRAYCMELVEHLYHDQAVSLLARLNRLVRPGGHLLLTTPNYHGGWPAIELALDLLHLVPRLKHDQHVTKFHKTTLREALVMAGWEIEHLTTFSTFAPFVSMLSWSSAQRVSALEDKLALSFGNILLAVAHRPAR